MKLTLNTPAKINAFLSVTGKRPDGYHTLETLFLIVHDLYDTIALERTMGPLEIATDAPIPKDAQNLCWKAVERFAEACPLADTAWRVKITKRIPIAGGMAGGSTDAAAVLRLLNAYYGAPLNENKLRAVALSLGADVPLFIRAESAFARGVGEEFSYSIPWKEGFEIPIVLAFSEFPVPAAWAYQHRRGPFTTESKEALFADALREGDLLAFANLVHNDLAPAVMTKFPILRLVEADLLNQDALKVMLSGSGPTLFAMARDFESAQKIANTLNETWKKSVRFLALTLHD